jgi:hypothetical protein
LLAFSKYPRHTADHFITLTDSFDTLLLAMIRKGKEAAAPVEQHPGGGHITVTAQQSRYALDAVDAPASKEVKSPLLHFFTTTYRK